MASFVMEAWVVSRPAYPDEKARGLDRFYTYFISPQRRMAIASAVPAHIYEDPKKQWQKLRKEGWRVEKCKVVILTDEQMELIGK